MFTIPNLLPVVSRAKIDKARILLERALGTSKILTSLEACERFAKDESEADGRVPDIVVLAETARDVRTTLETARKIEVPVTPRAAGTGRTGGAIPLGGGIVLSTLGMNAIKEIDRADLVAVVEPGVVLGELHAAVEAEGLFYPPDPNSLETCAIGGNIAENAGGPRAFKYGVTRDYVLGLEAWTMRGDGLRTGRRTVKGVAGYDLTSLLVGSEGTLAVVTEATLRLIPKPPMVFTLFALFEQVRAAGAAVTGMLGAGVIPRCVELVDQGALEAIRAQGVPVDPRAQAFLLIEVDGDEQRCEVEMARVGDACTEAGAIDVLVAQDASQRDRLWAARRALSPAVRKLANHKLAEDVVVPRSKIAAFLDMLGTISAETGVRMLTYGHAGDGNLHVNFLWDEDEALPRVRTAIARVFGEVLGMRGTISGEHGIGVLKAPYLRMEQSGALVAVQRELKAVFDACGLLNPGKIFPTD